MAKTCPSCGYNQIGPFTDNCPICAEPVRNVRSDNAGFTPRMNVPVWLRWVLGGVLAVVLCVAGCCGLAVWGLNMVARNAQKTIEQAQANAEAARKARTVAVAAAQLLQEFQDDPAAADRRYRGKHLQISGVVERVGGGGDDPFFVILHGGDEDAKVKIECYFNPADEDDEAPLQRLGKGQAVTVRGEYGGRVSHLRIRDCVLVK